MDAVTSRARGGGDRDGSVSVRVGGAGGGAGDTVPDDDSATGKDSAARSKWNTLAPRVFALVGLLVTLALAGHSLLAPHLDANAIIEYLRGSGKLDGYVLFFVSFALFELLHLPAVLLVAAGVHVWGPVTGLVVALFTAPLALIIPFVVARQVVGSGSINEMIKWKWAQKIFAQLEEKPVQTVALLRLVLFMAPPVTTALSLTSVSLHHYVLGSAVGLVVPITLCVLLSEQIFELFRKH